MANSARRHQHQAIQQQHLLQYSMSLNANFQEANQKYQSTLEIASSNFKSLLHSSNSKNWKSILNQSKSNSSSNQNQIINGISSIDHSNIQIDNQKVNGLTILRAKSEILVDLNQINLEDFKVILETSEIKNLWDNLVEKSSTIEILNSNTKITKTDFKLGWPSNPRDAITISKTFNDSNSIINISTSLPSCSDQPAFLRPSPPFVRSHVHLIAWYIRIDSNSNQTNPSSNLDQEDHLLNNDLSSNDDLSSSNLDQKHLSNNDTSSSSCSSSASIKPILTKAQITVFWKVNWKGAIFSTHHSQITPILSGFVDYVRNHANQIPSISSFGQFIDLNSSSYDKSGERLSLSYSVLPDDGQNAENSLDNSQSSHIDQATHDCNFQRSIEIKLSIDHGWDIELESLGQGEGVDESWEAIVEKPIDGLRNILRIIHPKLSSSSHQIVKVKIGIQRLAGGKFIRVNQKLIKPTSNQSTTKTQFQSIIDDNKSIGNLSLKSRTTEASKDETLILDLTSQDSFPPQTNQINSASSNFKPNSINRSKVISTLLRRSYIYFSSLLQEPEAKWKHVSDSRGVSVSQLLSIDPTLTVYRAEATFVGVGVWNVFSAITTAGARLAWDKSLTEINLLEELNDLSSLWHIKQKATWPISPRDSILITTTYKSPASVHLFSVSTDDSNLFPTIQPPSPTHIRTRTEIYGWSLESLSPTTTQITLIDQHDPLGWSPKSWTPAQLIAQVASVGEFTIKYGGPPIITRIWGARVIFSQYEHEKGTFRAEYTSSEKSLTPAFEEPFGSNTSFLDPSETSLVECELRCDCDTWASSLHIFVDPPPIKATCLRRHKLSSGGGWWVMIEHEADVLKKEKAKISIKRGRPGIDENGTVLLNGTNLKVDSEELLEEQVKNLTNQPRVKSSLIPLDQYSLFVPRLWKSSPNGSATCTRSASPVGKRHEEQSSTEPTGVEPLLSKKPIIPTSTKQAEPSHLSLPMSSALEALSRLKSFYIEQGPDFMTPPAGWTLVAEKGTSSVYKKIVSQISSVFPVYRTDQVIEGVTAEEMVTALAAVSMRPLWDDRIETSSLLESFGNGCTTHLLTTKARFPFQARLLKTANVHAMIQIPSSSINCGSNHTIHFVAAASFPKSDTLSFNYHKLNPQGLVEARMLLEGWIMETLDPYSSSSHEIPSTRCTYFNSIDYGGSIPVAFNSLLDSSLPRVIKAIAQLIKSPGPLPKLCRPIFGLRMDDSLGAHEFDDWKWKLSEPECSSVVVSIDATHQMDFQAIFLVQKGANEISFNNSPTSVNGSVGSTNTQPTPRHENVRQLGVSPPLVDSHNVAGSSTFVRRLVSTPELNPKLSAGQLRRAAGSGLHLTESKAPDMIVAELSLDRKSYPNGCRILWKLNFFKEKASMVLDQEIKFPDSPEADTMMVPIEVTIHEMPSPTVFAASLDPATRREHLLLRMTLPAGSVHSPIKDPLTANSEVEAKAPPLWYSQMSKRHAAVHLRIERIEIDKDDDKTLDEVKDLNQSKKTRRKSFNISVNGEEKKVIPIRDSQIALGRWEASDYIGPCRWLSRVNRLGKVITSKQKTLITSSITNHDLLPAELRRPCGISPDLVKESEDLSLSAPTPGSINQSPHPSSPVNEVGESEVVGIKNQDGLTNISTLDVNNRIKNNRLDWVFKDILQNEKLKGTLLNFTFIKQLKTIRTRTYKIEHLILISLISFLLGSILRSFLLPNDFIIFIPSSASSPTLKQLNAHDEDSLSSETKFIQILLERNNWKKIKRLIELKIKLKNLNVNWNLFIGIIRN